MKNIDIIRYPVDFTSPKPGSADAPAIIEKLCAPLFASTISAWHEAAVFATGTGIKKNGVKNRDEALRAVTRLAVKTANAQWNGNKQTLTLGGDHSQGLATIKASLLVDITRELVNGKTTLGKQLSTEQRKYIREELADKGQWITLATTIDNLIFRNVLKAENISDVTKRLSVIWVDGHADINNTATSTTKNFHGMDLAAALGQSAGGLQNIFGLNTRLHADNVYLMGGRDYDLPEFSILQALGVHWQEFDMHDAANPKIRNSVSGPGMPLAEAMFSVLNDIKTKRVIVSFDMDCLQEEAAPASGTQLAPGERLNYRGEAPPGIVLQDALEALFNLMAHDKLVAADVTELGYALGDGEKLRSDDGMTIRNAVRIMAAMLGLSDTVTQAYLKTVQDELAATLNDLVELRKSREQHSTAEAGNVSRTAYQPASLQTRLSAT